MDKQSRFKKDLFGYNTAEVDRYIERLEEEIRQRKEEGETLRNDIDSIRCNLEQLKRSVEEQRIPEPRRVITSSGLDFTEAEDMAASDMAAMGIPVSVPAGDGMMLDLEGAQAINEPKKKKGSKAVRIISDVLFYTMIAALLVCALAFSQREDSGISFFGYRYFNVLTSSMKPVYPPGTMIIVNTKKKDDVKVGDDITFYTSDTTTITHRIVEVMDNYDGKGNKGYRTKGVNQPAVDPDIRPAENVVGPVVQSVPKLGKVLTFIADNTYFLIFIFILLMVLSFVLRMIWGDDKTRKAEKQREKEEKLRKKQAKKELKM